MLFRRHTFINQYDHELRDCIAVLRDENSKLIVEIIELQRTIALNDEQVCTLLCEQTAALPVTLD
jgi:hypothetical protein